MYLNLIFCLILFIKANNLVPIECLPLRPKSKKRNILKGAAYLPMIPNFYIFQLLIPFEELTKLATITTRLCRNVGCLSYKIFLLTLLGSKDGRRRNLTSLAPIMCQPVYILTITPILFGRYSSHFRGEGSKEQKVTCPQSTNVIWEKPVFNLRSVWLQSSLFLFPLLREKLTEVHEELQKKQELIEDLQPDVNQNGRYL